jgi:hypothetical protein
MVEHHVPLVLSKQFMIGHVVSRVQAQASDWPEAKINSLSSTVSSNAQNALRSQEHVKRPGKPKQR